MLGISPEIGREFNADEDRAGGPQAVILSHAAWQMYLHSNRNVIGTSILLRGEPYNIVGVMPRGFRWEADVDLWTPLRPSTKGEGSGTNYGMIARLRPGATLQQAATQIAGIKEEIRKRTGRRPDFMGIGVVSLQEGITRDLRNPLKILWIAVAAVFFLGCVNIGGMQLARSSGRAGEIATRLALGAPLRRIIRQLMIESVVLGLFGGLTGAGIGWLGLAALRQLGQDTYLFLRFADLDWRVLAATLALTLLAGLIFGLAPAFQAARVDLRSAQTGSRTIAGRKRFVSLGTLVGGQVALTVPLLIGAGLLLHTFLYLWNLSPGFDANHAVTARFSMQDARYPTSQKVNQFYDRVIRNLHQIPGIESAAVTLSLPYERALNNGVRLPGQTDSQTTNLTYITPEYFTALRIPILQGRAFTAGDGAISPRVAVVNQAFVRRYMKDQAVLGQSVRTGGNAIEIVGVSGDVQEKRAGWGDFDPVAQVPMIYTPATQTSDDLMKLVHGWFSPNWIVRSSLPERDTIAAIEQATRDADPLMPPVVFRSFNDLKASALEEQRFMAALVDALGALAILLTTLGIYGLIANLVEERRKELGIRMALGSTTSNAIGIALRPALTWVAAGIFVGSVAAFGLERFLKSFLYGVNQADPITLIAVAAGLLLATAIASFAPASRIVRLNPADTLRSE